MPIEMQSATSDEILYCYTSNEYRDLCSEVRRAERRRCADLLDKLAETFKNGTAQSVELAFDLARAEMLVLAEELRDNT